MLIALHGNLRDAGNPAEVIGLVEQVQHVVHAGAREQAQLPVALRAAAAFALDDVRRARAVQEQLLLVLRHLYAVSADYLPRQVRDDARFRAGATLDVIAEMAREYLDDAAFEAVRGAGL